MKTIIFKKSIYQIVQEIAKKEKATIKNNPNTWSLYSKNSGGWIGAVDKNLNNIQGVAKKYSFNWDDETGWSILSY